MKFFEAIVLYLAFIYSSKVVVSRLVIKTVPFQMTEDLQEAEKEDMKHVVSETMRLLTECTQKYNSDKAR